MNLSNYYFFLKGNLKGTFFIPKMISEGTKLVFIGPMQGLLLSFIIPPLLLYLGIWVHVRTENNSRLYITTYYFLYYVITFHGYCLAVIVLHPADTKQCYKA